MTITPGTRLGPYEIVGQIGAGGMGEVWKAKDTRLGRDVAIKVLPPEFASDADRLRRFELEARTVSALNHPNILTLFDTGSHEKSPYLVTELLEGETLRGRLSKGPLPVSKALEISVQVARGLSAAHDLGIIHRDLKPENIFLTRDSVKILDFGLAKQAKAILDGQKRDLPTRDLRNATAEGTILGTVGYMSPEQVRGETVDARSDHFSLGVILWEMVTGARPFRGDSSIEVMHAILKSDPPELDSALKVPPMLERVLNACLAKEPGSRIHSAHDLAFALEGVWESSKGSGSHTGAEVVPQGWLRHFTYRWMAAALGSLLLAAVTALGWMALREHPKVAAVRTMITPPKGVEIVGRGYAIGLALSPDGRMLVFVGSTDTATCLFLRPLDSLKAEPIPGTANARHPFWSPDGREIAFFADRKLKVATVSSGTVRPLCETGIYPFGGVWGTDGSIYFCPEGDVGPISRIASSGGMLTQVTTLDPTHQEIAHSFPSLLAGGRHLLFTAYNGGFGQRILSLDTGKVVSLLPDIIRAEVFQDVLVYEQKDALLAQRLDLRSFKPLGQAVVLARGINTNAAPEMYVSFSADGKLACLLPSRPETPNLVWFDATGRTLGTLGSSPWYRNLVLSPDGSRVAADIQGIGEEHERSEVRLIEFRSGAETRLAVDVPWASDAAWNPDSSRLTMMTTGLLGGSASQSRCRILVVDVQGLAKPKILFESPQISYARDWAPNGQTLLLDRYATPVTRGDILAMRPEESTLPSPFLITKANEATPQFSADGAHITYTADGTGREEIYVASFPEAGIPSLVSSAGGRNSRWAPDGKSIYYLSLNDEFMRVAVTAENGRLSFGTPTKLFRVRPFPYNGHPFDIHPDGKRFLFSTAHDEGTSIVLVQNWISEVK
ncbi:MAG: serine/threonine-protein kinase [Holophagaceae bacterium]|nr:serine/threonine-protein kinase [Holophagaceae bacterium]